MPRPETLRFDGRVLYLTEDPALLRAQLHEGVALDYEPERPLVDNISTDEITPGWVCYYYDETLAEYCMVGLRGGVVQRRATSRAGASPSSCRAARRAAARRARPRRTPS
jgi:3-isopropylmalate/(R)-2-methylmalate dehydratase large subunit